MAKIPFFSLEHQEKDTGIALFCQTQSPEVLFKYDKRLVYAITTACTLSCRLLNQHTLILIHTDTYIC